MAARSIGVLWGVCLALLMTGCDCSGTHMEGGPCDVPEEMRPPECDAECSAEAPCEAGYYCHSSGVCTADCDPTNPVACLAPGTCTPEGRCLRPDSGGVDTGMQGCGFVNVAARRTTPNVILIIDQSSSMTAEFGSGTRWGVLQDSLLAEPEGLIFDMQSQVRFGLALYSAMAPGSEAEVEGECPMIDYVDVALDNYTAINTVYGPADPIDETPTGDSIDAVLARWNATPDPSDDPTIFILATDGEPDQCEQANPQEGQDEAIAAAGRAYAQGIRTFVIGVGDEVGEPHLQDMANTGRGMPLGTDCEVGECYFRPDDDAGLRDTLRAIIGGQLSCVVELDGAIQNLDLACSGSVELNGEDLLCDDPNGWRAIDATHIEILGTACTELQSGPGAQLEASFPCEVILI
jgi:hypothetical protein